MPLKFHCETCDASLTVSRRFAGRRGHCPYCRSKIRVPEIDVTESFGTSDQAADSGNATPAAESTTPTSDQGALSGRKPVSSADEAQLLTDSVAVPRWVIYTQAALLGIVATSFFVFGLAVGGSTRLPEVAEGELPPATAKVSGTVVFEDDGVQRVDEGCVVLILPVDQIPDPRPEPGTLTPERFVPLDNPAISTIRALGGEVVRVDRVGRFEANIASQREYRLLLISKNQSAGSQRVDRQMRADLGAWFFPVEDLLDDRSWRWQAIRVTGETLEVPLVVFGESS